MSMKIHQVYLFVYIYEQNINYYFRAMTFALSLENTNVDVSHENYVDFHRPASWPFAYE